MKTLVFVYGTLKDNYRNAHVNTGVRVPGDFITVERYPLYVLGPNQLPWLVNRPGEGEHVVGQLFEVDAGTLERMDVLERMTEPDWYSRGEIAVRQRGHASSSPISALVYFGSGTRVFSEVVHFGPLSEYTSNHAAQYKQNAP